MAKKTPPKSKSAAKSVKPVKLHEAPKSTRASVFRGINALLKNHGVSGRVAALHLEAAAPQAPSPTGDCPDGQVRRTVCTRDENGTIVCEEQCVPI